MFLRNSLKKEAIRTQDKENWATYKRIRNSTTKLIAEAKAEFYQTRLESNAKNPKEIWKTINNLMNRKDSKSTINEMTFDNKKVSDPQEIANRLNEHFASVGTRLASKLPEDSKHFEDYIKPAKTTFDLKPTNEKAVFSILTNISASKATGLDNVSCRLIKEAAPIIAKSLNKLFNKSIETNIFPSEWKLAKVTPIHKNNDRGDPNNYRLISVIGAIAKVFERVIYNQLYFYLTENNLLNKYQSGFRPLHSTVTALLDATNEWYFNMNEGHLTSVVFLDLAKAFDSVDHSILLRKLQLLGISERSLGWFFSYLDNRQQKCCIDGKLSDSCTIKCGVPQGSILGPLLFLIYINDFPTRLKYSRARMYADDTTISVAGNTTAQVETLMNADLISIKKWLESNKSTINVTKTEYILIGSSYKLESIIIPPNIMMGNEKIDRVKSSKCVGVHIDETLSWNHHTDYLSKKISRVIGGLKQVRRFVPTHTLMTIYKALIQPLFDYCDIVWSGLKKAWPTVYKNCRIVQPVS